MLCLILWIRVVYSVVCRCLVYSNSDIFFWTAVHNPWKDTSTDFKKSSYLVYTLNRFWFYSGSYFYLQCRGC